MQSYTVIATDGTPLQVFEQGNPDGPIIYLIHGVLTNHHFFDDFTLLFADRYRIISYDQRGHGESGDRAAKNCNLTQFAQDLSSIIHHVQGENPQEKAYFLGHSMGGMTIGSWLYNFPEENTKYAAGIALCNTAFQEVITHTKILGFHLPDSAFIKKYSWLIAIFPIRNTFISRYLANKINYTKNMSSHDLHSSLSFAETVSPQVTRKLIVAINHMDISAASKNVTVPTTVIIADHDNLLDATLGEKIAADLQKTGKLYKLEMLASCGHVTIRERPTEIYHIIYDSLQHAFTVPSLIL